MRVIASIRGPKRKACSIETPVRTTDNVQMIPSEIKFDANATPPQWTDDGEQVVEKGTNIRIKIKGLRSEVDKMYAVGTMKEVTITID